jgi:hypothetical protein
MEEPTRSKSWVADQGLTHWVRNDPRSVKAMISGSGDGREAEYTMFAAIERQKNPSVTDEQVIERFEAASQEKNRQIEKRSIVQAVRAREAAEREKEWKALLGPLLYPLWKLARSNAGKLLGVMIAAKVCAELF